METSTSSKALNITENALKVLEKRYLKRIGSEVVEGPEDMFRRVARTVAQADLNYNKSEFDVRNLEDAFYEMITSFAFLPNSPTLMNAGRKLGQLSACFVIPVEDSMESIFEAVKSAALIHKSGGGTGFSFSRLRPKGDIVGSTKGISSGPVSFMTVFDAATETIKQGGTRRGANMAVLRVDHPDIIEFITCKDYESKLNNFNISVAVTKEFMGAVSARTTYPLVNPRTGETLKELEAKNVFDLMVNHAWKNGEPGIVFLDRINAANPTPHIGRIESTNPCGEQPLLPYESCNLGSINLSKFVKTTKNSCTTLQEKINWEGLKNTVHLAVHFLDNVIDVNRYPLEEIKKLTLANRKIGLGVMGWADMLIQLGLAYHSEAAIQLGEEVMAFIHKEALGASSKLAVSRGVFPNYKGSIYDSDLPLRNATVTTIAPTGTLSIIAGCSSGIEPLFAVSFVRNVLDGTKMIDVNPYFEKTAIERGFWSSELMEAIAKKGSVQGFEEIPEDIKQIFVTAHDIKPESHILMQAAFQRYVDNAVSKTVNFPNEANPMDIETVFLSAYELGCKGVTVYRDGSREQQVLSTGKTTEKQKAEELEAERKKKIVPKKRPEVIKGATYRMNTGCGNLYVTINEDEGGSIFEVFTQMGKAGGCAASQSEAIGRLISLAFRIDVDPHEIITQLKGIRCHSPAWYKGSRILSCSDALAQAIEKAMTKNPKNNKNKNGNGTSSKSDMIVGACPECGGVVEHEGGCSVCHDCGFTRC